MTAALDGWHFARVYGAFPGRNILSGGEDAVAQSAARYIDLLNDR